MDREIRDLLAAFEAQGFTAKRTQRGHWIIRKDGGFVTALPGTPSDWRGLRNAIAQARRHGFVHRGR